MEINYFIKNKYIPVKNVKILSLTILNVIGGIILNIYNLDVAPNELNVFVTFIYLTIWTFLIIVVLKRRQRKLLILYSVFWFITFVTAIMNIYIHEFDINFYEILPFYFLLNTQMYGIIFFVDKFMYRIFISLISFTFYLFSLISYIWINNKKR